MIQFGHDVPQNPDCVHHWSSIVDSGGAFTDDARRDGCGAVEFFARFPSGTCCVAPAYSIER